MRLLPLLLIISFKSLAQTSAYPKDYFRNPLNIPIFLAGNFGECRPGHFHSGIDIKTEGKENYAVFAAAEGYISRVKMEPGGFGHGIYITHPNGYTTLYAHLNDFFPELQKLVRATQYKNKNWELDLTFDADKFPVKKGQQIALSGNTGGSSAPHLHFEIRDSKTEHPLNPQLFGFKIEDNISPVPTEIALYNANRSIYEQDVLRLPLKKTGQYYVPIKDSVVVSASSINIGVAVNDFMNNSRNTLSFYTAKWYANDSLMGTLTLDDIGYDETRYLNACADYKLKKETDYWFNSLFLLPNNKLERIYNFEGRRGGNILLNDIIETRIRIVLNDANNNETEIKFLVIGWGSKDSETCNKEWKAGEKNTYAHPNLKFDLPAPCLYDDICFETAKKTQANSVSPRFQLHNPNVPVHQYFELNIKPDKAIPFSFTNKIALLYSDSKSISGKKTTLSEGWYNASVRAFGDYWLAIDTTAPTIKPLIKSGQILGKKKEIRFTVSDNFTSIKKFSGTINGNWICLEQHGSSWFYKIDEHCPKGKNKLELIAVDENGNERKMDYYFTR